MTDSHFDYIIAGSGAAGLSLAYRLAQPAFANKRILLIDRSAKQENDRTWCFWEAGVGLFDPVVYRSWEKLAFYGPHKTINLAIYPYRYKMIRGKDFYTYSLAQIHAAGHITVLKAEIYDIDTVAGQSQVDCSAGSFTADWTFSSLLSNEEIHQAKKGLFLWQHFKGWIVKTKSPAFEPDKAVFMDFRVPQVDGSCFVYVLPFEAQSALVEFTVFSEEVWDKSTYDLYLRDYLRERLGITDFEIEQTETGRIPMASHRFPVNEGRTIFLGTAGGQTKGSTGYTFQNIQRHSHAIVSALSKGKSPRIKPTLAQKRFRLYDNTLLRVLCQRYYPGADLFEQLFAKNPSQRVLGFLDESTGPLAELAIMNSVPRGIFAKAVFEQLVKG